MATTTITSGVQYSGKWTLQSQAQAVAASTWPVPPLKASFWSWGYNVNGRLGDGTVVNKSSPVQIGALTDWGNNLGEGSAQNSAVIKNTGNLWMWGDNGYTSLGLGNTTHYSSPKQVGSLTTWAKVVNSGPTIAIKTDGTLWAWGQNNYGQLGLGDITNRSSPVQVGALTNWAFIDASEEHVVAVKTDGTLWSWGRNNNGQLGLGNITNYSSPKQVGSLTGWLTAAAGSYRASFAVRTTGELYSWGKGEPFGQLGLSNITSYSSPKQVGTLTNWLSVSAGSGHVLSKKTNGTIWSWGRNSQGQLGLENTTYYSSPKQIGALVTWSSVVAGPLTSFARKTDGTIWSWGSGEFGSGGQDTISNYSSPKQIGALTTWLGITAFYAGGSAVKSA